MHGSNKIVTTKKAHTCFSCLRKFDAGTQMDKWSCVYEGSWNSGYTCMTCDEIHDIQRKIDYWMGDFVDGIPEGYVNECLDPGQTPEDYLLSIKTKSNETQFQTGR